MNASSLREIMSMNKPYTNKSSLPFQLWGWGATVGLLKCPGGRLLYCFCIGTVDFFLSSVNLEASFLGLRRSGDLAKGGGI